MGFSGRRHIAARRGNPTVEAPRRAEPPVPGHIPGVPAPLGSGTRGAGGAAAHIAWCLACRRMETESLGLGFPPPPRRAEQRPRGALGRQRAGFALPRDGSTAGEILQPRSVWELEEDRAQSAARLTTRIQRR